LKFYLRAATGQEPTNGFATLWSKKQDLGFHLGAHVLGDVAALLTLGEDI
jgi:hypothetical protein